MTQTRNAAVEALMGALLLGCASIVAAQAPARGLAAPASATHAPAAQAPPTQTSAARKPGEYALTPDSLPQPGVPRGKLEGPFEFHSRIFAGTVRRYWIFV